MGENPSEFKGDDRPMETVSWHAAALLCELLSRREARRVRLPTDAEDEHAARAGTTGPVSGTAKLVQMSWRADNSDNQPRDPAKMWYHDADNALAPLTADGCRTRPVGAGSPSAWGI